MRSRILLSLATLAVAASTYASTDALGLVPLDAATVGMAKVSDIRNSPLTGRLISAPTDMNVNKEAQRFMDEAGLKPTDDIDAAIVSIAGATETRPRMLAAFDGRFDPARLTAAVTTRGGTAKQYHGASYLLLPSHEGESETVAVAFPDPHLVLAGSEAAVQRALDDRTAGGSQFVQRAGLGRELGRIAANATSWLLIDVPRSTRISQSQTDGPGLNQGPAAAALKRVAVIAMWATDTHDALQVGATALSSDEETRGLIADLMRGALSTWRLAAQDKAPGLIPVLRNFVVSDSGDAVTIRGSVPADLITQWNEKMKAAELSSAR